MQDYSCIYVSVMVLTNTTITPSTHNLKQPEIMLPGIFRTAYTYNNLNTTLFLHILSASFCFYKTCNNRIFTPDMQSQNSQHRALKKYRKEPHET